METIRRFRTICDVCLRELDGELQRDGNQVYHCKECPEHGPRRWLISRNGESYVRYDRHYHAVFPSGELSPEHEDIRFFITNACNLGCSYCAFESTRHDYFSTYDLDLFQEQLRSFRGLKVSLIGGEPLCDPRVFEFLKKIEEAGKLAVVCTNGLALANDALVRRIKETSRGRCEVRMTFEGFSEEDYDELPARPRLLETKLRALDNLKRNGVCLTLAHTISRAEQRDPARLRRVIASLARYSMKESFVNGVTIQAVTAVGSSRDLLPEDVMPIDAVMDEIVAASPVPMQRRDVYLSAQLLHLLSRIFELPLCEYRQAAVLLRDGDRWMGIDAFLDCDRLQRRLDARVHTVPAPRWKLLARLAIDLLASARLSRMPGMARLGLQVLPLFTRRWDYSSIPHSILPLNAGTTCDRYNLDLSVAARCEKTFHSQLGASVWKESASETFVRQLRERASN